MGWDGISWYNSLLLSSTTSWLFTMSNTTLLLCSRGIFCFSLPHLPSLVLWSFWAYSLPLCLYLPLHRVQQKKKNINGIVEQQSNSTRRRRQHDGYPAHSLSSSFVSPPPPPIFIFFGQHKRLSCIAPLHDGSISCLLIRHLIPRGGAGEVNSTQ